MKCFRTLGEKGEFHPDSDDHRLCRANKQRGHGSYDNHRQPFVSTVCRERGQVRLRLVHHPDQETLEALYTLACIHVYTDEWNGYTHINRPHATVC